MNAMIGCGFACALYTYNCSSTLSALSALTAPHTLHHTPNKIQYNTIRHLSDGHLMSIAHYPFSIVHCMLDTIMHAI